MSSLRPVARDSLLSGGLPVIASRRIFDDRSTPCRTRATHSYAVLLFCTAGTLRTEQDGRWHVALGDVLLVPAGTPHRSLAREGLEAWGLGFCVSCFAADRGVSLLEPFERVREGASAVVHIPARRHGYLAGLFAELAGLEREPSTSFASQDAIARSLLTLILAEVDRASVKTARPRRSGVVVDALRYIERHCLGQLTLQQVAAAVGRSPTYVTAALTEATGRSAGRWIVSGRMAEARRLLLHSDERVEIIAERVGYSDTTHFIRMFRREHGATPAAWRAAQHSG